MKNSIWSMIAALGCICIVSATLMGSVYAITAGPMSQAELNARKDAIRMVTNPFDNDPIESAREITLDGDAQAVTVYPVTLGGENAGMAVESYSLDGFDGEIRIMFGFAPDGTITGYSVLKQTETPGLGAKMDDWFRDPTDSRSVIGRNPSTDNLTVSKDGGEIDGITAATISSRAFLDALRRAHDAFSQN